MPKGAPGQPRKPGAGRKHSRDYGRTTIIVSKQVLDYLKRNGNISQEVEQIAREKMNGTCPKCGCGQTETRTDGHCNNHDQPNYQVTTVTYYCAECGEFIKDEVFETH